MNLAGNRAKHLFRSLRTGGSPPIIGLWTAATAVDQIRKRSTRPAKELIVRKQLKPGQSYLIRVPGKGEAPLAGSLPAGTQVAEVDPPGEEPSIATQLLDAATDLLAAGVEAKEEAGVAETPDRRRRRRRRRRKASETSDGPAAAKVSRRDSRLASLDDFETDRDALPSRLRRKLNRAEKRARKRPSRRRVRKARKQHKRAARASAGVEQPAQPSRRRRRRLRAATRNLEERRAKVDKRSTRRRRRKLRNAEKAYKKLE